MAKLFFFRKSAYMGGDDRNNPLNLLKWNQQMCEDEFNEGDNPDVAMVDLNDEDYCQAYCQALEDDYNNGCFSSDEYLLRVFP